MKNANVTWSAWSLGGLMLAMGAVLSGCQTVQRVNIPSAQDQAAYQPSFSPYAAPFFRFLPTAAVLFLVILALSAAEAFSRAAWRS